MLPEADGIADPAFGYGACAKAEAVGKTVVGMELGRDAEGGERFQAALHGAPRGDAVGRATTGVCGGIG